MYQTLVNTLHRTAFVLIESPSMNKHFSAPAHFAGVFPALYLLLFPAISAAPRPRTGRAKSPLPSPGGLRRAAGGDAGAVRRVFGGPPSDRWGSGRSGFSPDVGGVRLPGETGSPDLLFTPPMKDCSTRCRWVLRAVTAQDGSMATWQHGNMATWQHGSMAAWRHGYPKEATATLSPAGSPTRPGHEERAA